MGNIIIIICFYGCPSGTAGTGSGSITLGNRLKPTWGLGDGTGCTGVLGTFGDNSDPIIFKFHLKSKWI